MAGPTNGSAGAKDRQQRNCLVWMEDDEQAQRLLNRQLEMDWAELLNLIPAVHERRNRLSL